MRSLGVLLLLGLAVGGGFYYAKFLRAEQPPNLRTAAVERGDMLITISATGTLEPVELVDVGAQVVGRIDRFGDDPRGAFDPMFKGKHVDYGSPVEDGTVLAEIDDALYRATYNEAKAGLMRAKADLIQLNAKLAQAKAEWDRAQRLRDLKLTSVSGIGVKPERGDAAATIKGISDSDYILAKANFEVAKANLAVGEALIEQQQAALDSAETNLGYTIIKSPVQGTIIDRRVNIGQTVVSSLNAPSLFLIAKDLRRMEVWAQVNEADIGQLKVGMPVHFTVDAFPDDVFHGQVSQVRLNAKDTQNVIIYTVAVMTNNDDLKLLPYLTADVRFEVDHRTEALLVPNAALRYRPRAELILRETAGGAAPEVRTQDTEDPAAAKNRRTVWVKQGSFVRPVDVTTGVTDGSVTEIVGGGLSEGDEVVLSEHPPDAPVEENNPFAFRRPGGGKKQSQADAK